MNNFDQSSSGVNLELTCYFDNDLSAIWFNDMFTLDGEFVIHHDLGLSIDDLGFKSGITPDKIKNIAKKLFLEQYDLSSSYKDNKESLSEFIDHLSHGGSSLSDINPYFLFTELIEHFGLDFYHSHCKFHQFIDKDLLNYHVYESRGYSQGDYKTVFLPLNIEGGEWVNNIIWDSPLRVRLCVNDEEFFIDGGLESVYNYDTVNILEVVRKELEDHENIDYIVSWVADNLPEYPDYK